MSPEPKPQRPWGLALWCAAYAVFFAWLSGGECNALLCAAVSAWAAGIFTAEATR